MKPLEERNRARRVPKDAGGVEDDAGFDLAKMGRDFGGGPGDVGRARLPVGKRDSVGGGQIDGLRTKKICANGVEVRHSSDAQRRGRER